MDDSKIYKILEDGINRAIIKISQKAKRALSQKLANRTESEYYNRTHQLEDSLDNPPYVRITGGGNVKVRLYDPNKILSTRTKRGMYNEHMSLKGQTTFRGIPISHQIMTWQDLGYKLPNGKFIKGLHFVNDVLEGETFEDYITEKVFYEIKDDFFREIQNLINRGGGK